MSDDRQSLESPMLQPVRGASETGPTAFRFEFRDHSLLLDCGACEGDSPDWIDDLPPIDACWVSHAHRDHLGALPELVEKHPQVTVLASPQTRQLAISSLTARSDVSHPRAEAIADRITVVEDSSTCVLESGSGSEISIKTFEAGHIPGARMLGIGPCETAPAGWLLYTGDFSLDSNDVRTGASVRELEACAIHTLLCEGTLATEKKADETDFEKQLQSLRRYVSDCSGGCLVPVESMGESVQMWRALRTLEPPPVFHDALVPALELGGFESQSRCASSPETADEATCRSLLDADRIVVAPGDQMSPTTASYRLRDKLLSHPDARIALINRVQKGTPASHLLAAANSRDSRLPDVGPVRAGVQQFYLPNHATRSELIEFIDMVGAEHTLLVHGDRGGLYALKRALENKHPTMDVAVPTNGEQYFLAPD